MSLCLTLYSRPGCHLCEDLALELDGLCVHHPFTFQVVNIDRDPRLIEQYGRDIPVLCDPHGRVLCRHRLDHKSLRRFLASVGAW